MGKNHTIQIGVKSKKKFITILPQESFVEKLMITGNVIKFKMRSGEPVYSATVDKSVVNELMTTAKEGGSIGTFYNTRLRNLDITKGETF